VSRALSYYATTVLRECLLCIALLAWVQRGGGHVKESRALRRAVSSAVLLARSATRGQQA